MDLITDYWQVEQGFQAWLQALARVSDTDQGYEIAGSGVGFRSLRGERRTEFWVRGSIDTAVQINMPNDPQTENGLSGLATDVDGKRYIVRQGVLHENNASVRVIASEFAKLTGAEPLNMRIEGSPTSRTWFLVSEAGGNAADVGQQTAAFVRRCWLARQQKGLPELSGRVWITSFWGFNPENEGYLGFTEEGDRTWFLREWKQGDVVLVYGTLGADTPEELRGRALGFLEVEPKTIRDTERMSEESKQWKLKNGLGSRWSYAVPVSRAWRIVNKPTAREIAPETLNVRANWQLISRRGKLLAEHESKTALALEVYEVSVFKGKAATAEEKSPEYKPSRGFPLSFGERSHRTTDGEHYLYALSLNGDVAALMGRSPSSVRSKVIVKVGLTKNPDERCQQHNVTLPPSGQLRWRILLRSKPLENGQTALKAETALKERFASLYESLGGEFFLCDERTLPVEFARITMTKY